MIQDQKQKIDTLKSGKREIIPVGSVSNAPILVATSIITRCQLHMERVLNWTRLTGLWR